MIKTRATDRSAQQNLFFCHHGRRNDGELIQPVENHHTAEFALCYEKVIPSHVSTHMTMYKRTCCLYSKVCLPKSAAIQGRCLHLFLHSEMGRETAMRIQFVGAAFDGRNN